jgi:nucleotide-binding universal stress UspA family protein
LFARLGCQNGARVGALASGRALIRITERGMFRMTHYKTIVVHLADERRAERVLGVAARLAQQQDAHLIGLFVGLPRIINTGFNLGKALIEQGMASIRDRAAKIEATFEAAAPGLGIRKEWRFVEPGRRPALDVLLMHLRSADLIVASQSDLSWDDSLLMEYPEDLLLQSGRPVLYVPNAGQFDDLTGRVLVAWNDRREAARAAFDALPLLKQAKDVRVLWVNPEQEASATGDVPTAEIVKSLARHGIQCTAAAARGSDHAAGTELLNQVTDVGATMLVMGGYGHRRLREYVFGGATREVLRQMTVPVLMSH